MKILKIIGQVLFSMVGIIIFATILALGVLFTYFPLQNLLFGRGDYLLFVSGSFNIVPVIMLLLLIIYAFFQLKEKISKRKAASEVVIEEQEEPLDFEPLTKAEKIILKSLDKFEVVDRITTKVFKIIKICYIPILIIAIYCGMTSYAVLYSDSIKLSSPTVPSGINYKYSEVKNIQVGVKRENRNSYSPYYIVIFKDGRSVNLFGGSMQEGKDISFENILIDLDKKLRSQGVSKSVSKENFERYSKGLDKDFISRVERLFDEF